MKRIYRILLIIAMATSGLQTPAAQTEERDVLHLNVAEVRRLALENNFDIQVYRLDKEISEKELLKAVSVYDTELDTSYEYDEDKLKRSSTISGSRVTTVAQEASLTKQLPTGTTLSLGIAHKREASDSSFSSLRAYHESEASASITQPFGKNAWGVIDRNDVEITKLDIQNTHYTSMDKIEQELATTQKAYWNLLLAHRQLDVTEELLESAGRLYENSKKRFDIGLTEPPEFYAIDANLKEKQKDVLLARDNVNTATNLMILKLGLDKETRITPKDDFVCKDMAVSFEDLLRIALRNRRDYALAKNNVKINALYIEMKKNEMWPQIDLKGTLKKNGLSEEFSTSMQEIHSENYPEYAVEVEFSFPLENSSARAEYSQKELQKVKTLVELKKAECLVLVEAHDAFIHARSVYESVKLLEEAAGLQRKKYAGEEDRFNKGRSDTDRLIRYQNDYLGAQLKHLRSLYDYKAALIDLEVATNTLLGERGGKP